MLPINIKDVMHDEVHVGDWIICRGKYVKVLKIVDHPAGEHDNSPIYNHMTAREFITELGSRWKGI